MRARLGALLPEPLRLRLRTLRRAGALRWECWHPAAPAIRLVERLRGMEPLVILVLDGGIGSQMKGYCQGHELMRQGYLVKFDTSWFRDVGHDLLGRFVRNLDLPKAFPGLPFEEASDAELAWYRRHHTYRDLSAASVGPFDPRRHRWLQARPPVYLAGYYALSYPGFRETFQSLFRIDPAILDAGSREVHADITRRPHTVGVHVRRGDMAVDSGVHYWDTLPPAYFVRAIERVRQTHPDAFVYFFSDEVDWVRTEIVPILPAEVSWRIVDVNGSDKGYQDLLLLASCQHQIASQGSFGKFASLLNPFPGKTCQAYARRPEDTWKGVIPELTLLGIDGETR